MDAEISHESSVARYFSFLQDHPEKSWKEEVSQQFVRHELLDEPLFQEKTALVYSVGTGIPVFFRAELDAITTENGLKHACGHSSHAAALMGAYRTLRERPVPGFKIYFVFQPSEEDYPSGAAYISQNFPELTACRAGFAFHVYPWEQKGAFLLSQFAGADFFQIEVQTQGTHIKNKNQVSPGTDALGIASQCLQEINAHHDETYIMNVGTLEGGSAPNSIAGKALLQGDVRYHDERDAVIARSILEKLVARLQENFPEARVVLKYFPGYPPLNNDEHLARTARTVLSIEHQLSSFATEDFSLFPVPLLYILVGTGENAELHSAAFASSKELAQHIYRGYLTIARQLSLFVPTA